MKRNRVNFSKVACKRKQKWNNYIDFWDYLNDFPEKAIKYDECKQNLAKKFSDDHRRYTEGKKKLIAELIEEAKI